MPSYKNDISVLEVLSTLDWFIFFLVLLLTVICVIWGHRKKSLPTFLDNLLMSRQLTLPLFIATLVSTWYGGIFGVTQIAFENGVYNFITQGIFWYLTYIIFALFLVKRLHRSQALTLPELINKMFGPKSARLGSILTLTNVLPIAYIISLGLFIQSLSNFNLEASMFLGLCIVLSYSSWGGFRSVVYSDIVQFIVMCLSVIFVIFFSVSSFGLDHLFSNLPNHYFSLTGKHSIGETLSWGLIALATLIDPNFYQRCFAAKDIQTAKKGIFLSTLIWIIFDLCTTFGAMYAKATLPEAESGGAYLIYSLQLLPSGLRGFFVAGILATILSTLDSYLFLAGTTISYDILPKKLKSLTLSIITSGFVAYFIALSFDGNIKSVWKLLGSLSASGMLLPILFGYTFPNRLKDHQFFAIAIAGITATIFWKILSLNTYFDEIYFGMATTFILLSLTEIKTRLVS